MRLKTGVQMDPIERINISGDFNIRAYAGSAKAPAQHILLHA